MEIQFIHRFKSTQAVVSLSLGESITIDSASLVSMDTHLFSEPCNTATPAARSVFTATEAPGDLVLAPALPGDIFRIPLQKQTILLQSFAYLASTQNVSLSPFSHVPRGMFPPLLSVSGVGEVLCAGFGSVTPFDLKESLVVESGHLLAFDASLSYRKKQLGGWKSFLFLGEESFCEFRGSGKVFLQNNNSKYLANRLSRVLPPHLD